MEFNIYGVFMTRVGIGFVMNSHLESNYSK